ncbi:DMT family transporter [Paraburkholderia phenoliruptrix]|uniref:DMT family transporter n=1 Tax=Paraburkholderia phenoliruptrix TaxID=252970 RepID=UPI002869AFAC|nr:DMT family transporter [Paraburkholderia phenoliruptrix]WMY12830.1 DMT family transporter [Paraburkholderia phenoliruptrix]
MSNAGIAIRNINRIRPGVGSMLAAMGCLVVSDAFVKSAAASMSSSQLLLVQSSCATALLLALALMRRTPFRLVDLTQRRVLLLAAAEVIGMVTLVVGIAHLQLAVVIAIYMAIPLLTTAGSVIILREKVSGLRWAAIGLGFAGVLCVVQPATDQFAAWSVLILLSACFYASRDIAMRSVSRSIPSQTITIAAVGAVMMTSMLWVIADDWKPLEPRGCCLIAGASISWLFGYFLIAAAMRKSELGVVGPFRYSSLIYSSILGYVIWNETPNLLASLGMLLVVASGVHLVRTKSETVFRLHEGL